MLNNLPAHEKFENVHITSIGCNIKKLGAAS